MNLIKSLAKSVLTNGQLKKNLTVSRIDDSCNKEREVQNVGNKDIVYEPLLDNMDAETLMNEGNFEIDMGSSEGLQGVKQDDPILKYERKLAAQERPGTSEKEQVDGRSRHEQTVVYDNERSCHFRWPHGN